MRVGVILDEFSMRAFAPEWTLIALDPQRWREQLRLQTVDFLFVEAAWAGNGGAWRHLLAGPGEPGRELRDLVAWCREAGTPTVFWNKEDPAHYADFRSTAHLFDVVLTTDASMVDRYRQDAPAQQVGVLPFAAQPTIHNPVRPMAGHRSRGIAFAGMYFGHKFPQRRRHLDALLAGAMKSAEATGDQLEIFARHADVDDRYRFPEPFNRFVVGSLDYARMLTAYRAYRVFLNVNTIADSPTMCARRMFELPASGVPMVTAPSDAIDTFFAGTGLAPVTTAGEAASAVTDILRRPADADRVLHRIQRRIWDHHTYAHRAEEVVRIALPGRHRPVTSPTVSAVVSCFRPHRVEDVLRVLGAQRDVDMQVVLLTHGFEIDRAHWTAIAENHGLRHITVLSASRDVSLGECLNRCVEAADGTVIAKIDDDDGYGPDYLHDALHALAYSHANVVGKQAHYLYLPNREMTVLRSPEAEHRFTALVPGPTMVGARDIFRQHPFAAVTRGEDTGFLTDVSRAGGVIYSADRFNYYRYRGSTDHTWQVSEESLLIGSENVLIGHAEQHSQV
ncbi:CgeB family protein [Tersicoccus phoenicis]|uniref:CgeB family protein n=1 Tax=Tersicoccus phoenicis TaxID=554083 RepID=UPI00135629F7|nr:glycosyltransferase [Tersicoccus phoenicis]